MSRFSKLHQTPTGFRNTALNAAQAQFPDPSSRFLSLAPLFSRRNDRPTEKTAPASALSENIFGIVYGIKTAQFLESDCAEYCTLAKKLALELATSGIVLTENHRHFFRKRENVEQLFKIVEKLSAAHITITGNILEALLARPPVDARYLLIQSQLIELLGEWLNTITTLPDDQKEEKIIQAIRNIDNAKMALEHISFLQDALTLLPETDALSSEVSTAQPEARQNEEMLRLETSLQFYAEKKNSCTVALATLRRESKISIFPELKEKADVLKRSSKQYDQLMLSTSVELEEHKTRTKAALLQQQRERITEQQEKQRLLFLLSHDNLKYLAFCASELKRLKALTLENWQFLKTLPSKDHKHCLELLKRKSAASTFSLSEFWQSQKVRTPVTQGVAREDSSTDLLNATKRTESTYSFKETGSPTRHRLSAKPPSFARTPSAYQNRDFMKRWKEERKESTGITSSARLFLRTPAVSIQKEEDIQDLKAVPRRLNVI